MPDAERVPEVVFVRSRGEGSMDRAAQRLSAQLPVTVLDAAVFRRSGELFGVRPLSLAALRVAWRERRLMRRLRSAQRPLHFPNHHFARYGLSLQRPYVVTVHDTIRWSDAAGESVHIHVPSARDRRILAADAEGIRRAAGVIAVSRHTAAEAAARFGLRDELVEVVHNGVDHDVFHPRGPRTGSGRSVLFVGSEHPRKNLDLLLDAYALLRRDPGMADLRLVKVGAAGGPEGAFRSRTRRTVRALGIERGVEFTGSVSDAQLAALYRGASCLVLPSRAEGFGLPPLEAMACGCPVVVARAGALPEIAGPAAVLVDPDDAGELADAIRSVLDRPELRRRLRLQGLAHAARFRWDAAAEATLAAYARFLAPQADATDGAAGPTLVAP